MKKLERLVTAVAFVLAMLTLGTVASADTTPKPNRNTDRTNDKPASKWKLFKSHVKSLATQQVHMFQYIRGEGAPEYDAPVGHIPR